MSKKGRAAAPLAAASPAPLAAARAPAQAATARVATDNKAVRQGLLADDAPIGDDELLRAFSIRSRAWAG